MSSKGVPGLEVISGPASGTRLKPRQKPLVLGREADDEGRLGDDAEISRRHARISRAEDGQVMVEDLGSTNGTFVNGERISGPTAVKAGDTVALGETTLRVLAPIADVYGGVHTVPTDLLSVLVARAPVRKEWVIKAALTALPIVLAINFVIRTVAVEYLDVRSDLATMKPGVLFLISVMPTLGNGVGFYKNFGRPADHSVAHYLVPTSLISLFWATLEIIALPSDASVTEYVVTIVVATVAPSVVVPTMLALRVRAGLAAERRLRGGQSSAAT
jgi:peptidoglycan hydrolase-like protein with peptidoglycan-binding domain